MKGSKGNRKRKRQSKRWKESREKAGTAKGGEMGMEPKGDRWTLDIGECEGDSGEGGEGGRITCWVETDEMDVETYLNKQTSVSRGRPSKRTARRYDQ